MSNGIQVSGHGPSGGGGYGPPGGGYGPPGDPGGGGYGGPMGAAQAMPGASGGPVGPAPAKRSRTGLIIGLVIGALILLGAVVGGLALYYFSDAGKDRSVAHEHLPSTCDIVARGDIAKIQSLPSFQTHVKPALDELKDEKIKVDDPDAADLKMFLIEARLDPSKDIHDAVACIGDPSASKPKFAVILGGEFSTTGVVDAAARRGDSPERVTVAGQPAVKSKSKKSGEYVWIGQAEDGAIILSNDEGLLAAAMKRTDAHSTVYKLDVASELSFVVTAALVTKQQGQLKSNPFTKGLTNISGVTGSVGMATPGGQLRLVTASAASAATLEKEVSGLLALAKLGLADKAGQSKAGEMDSLQNAKTSVQGSDVVVDLPWTAQGVDQAMKLFGDGIREAQKKKAI